jgi:hypothetical protein
MHEANTSLHAMASPNKQKKMQQIIEQLLLLVVVLVVVIPQGFSRP